MTGALPNPLLRLARFFEEAREHTGIVVIPESLKKEIESYLNLLQHTALSDVKAVVEAIDHVPADGREALCHRLDTRSSAILCGVLKHSHDCLPYQRGLCLLTESMYENALSSQSQRALRLKKKIALGSLVLSSLLRSFMNIEKSENARRWLGSLTLELLKDCEENKARLRQEAETSWRALGGLLAHGKSQVLRLIAGSIIREMLASGLTVKDFWPDPAETDMFAGFPKSQHHTAAWVTNFEVFIDNLTSQHVLTQGRADVLFAHAVLVQEVDGKAVRYSTDNESAILVTKSEDLVILLPPSENGPAIYIDVPIKYIGHATVATLEESSQLSPVMDRTVVALSIQTSHTLESSCYINAVQRRTKSIEIAFDNLEAAQSVKRLIATDTPREIEHLRASQSVYNIDVSQPNDDRMDSSDMPDPIMADIEHRREPIPPADDIPKDQSLKYPSISQAEKAIDISQLQINGVSISHCFLEGSEHLIATASHANALLPIETPLELSNLRQLDAIDAQPPESLDRRENQAKVTNGPLSTLHIASRTPGIPVHLGEEGFYQSGEQLEDASEAGLDDSAHWSNGKRLIDRTPEIENLPKEPYNQQRLLEEQRRKFGDSFPPQDEDHNGLYDASPRAPQGEPQPAELTHVNQENLARVTPASKQRSKTDKSSSKKLTKRMRNDDGDIATQKPTKIARKPQTFKKPSSRGKNADTGNGNTGGQVQSKRPQGKRQTKTPKSTTGDNHTVEAFDEFEIPDSPPRPKGHRKPVSKASPTTQNTTKTHSRTEKRDVASKSAMLSTSSPGSTWREQPGNARKAQLSHKARSADAVNWDEDLNVDETEIEVSSRPGKRKAAKSMTVSVAKSNSPKVAQADPAEKRSMTGKARPAPLTKPRIRRAAALAANKKIQGIAESDASEKEEALGIQPSKPNGRINMVQDKKLLNTSHSPGDHGKSGSVTQKIISTVTPPISLNNQQRHNQSKSASRPQAQAEPLAPKTDPKTSPSDQMVLVNHSETLQNAVEMKQGLLQRDELGTTSYVLNGEHTGEKDVPVLGDVDTGELDFVDMEDSHFQDAMAFSTGNNFHSSKSPIPEGNGPNLAVDYTIKETQASELSHVRIQDKSLENTEKVSKTSISKSREPWASKLIGALKTVPRVLEVKTPKSLEKIAKQTPTQHVSYNIAKAGESRPTNGIEAQEHEHQYHGQMPTSAQVPTTDAAYASPAVRSALKPLMTQPLEIAQVSSGVEDSSGESVVDNPDIRNDTTIDPIQTAAWAAQDGLDMPRAADTMPQVLAAKSFGEVEASESVTKLKSKQRKTRGAEILRPSSTKAITNAFPNTSPGGIETKGHAPDLKRKSNLISFSAKGPRNQGVASSQKPETLIVNEHQAAHTVYPEKRQVYKLEHENNDSGEVPPEDRPLIEMRTIALAGDDRAPGTAPRKSERRVSKLTSKLQKAMLSTARNDVAITSPDGEVENALIARILNTVPVAAAPTLAAQPFVPVANMGSNSRAKSRRRENKVSTSTLTTVPVGLPDTTPARLDPRPSLPTPRLVDATPRENKRQADEFGVEELNDIALGKRRKLFTKAPVAEMIVPELVSKRNRSIEQNLSQRTGSQSVRVNENGSPVPLARGNDNAKSQPRLTQDIVRLPAKARLDRVERNQLTLPFDESALDETGITFGQVSRTSHSKKWPLGSSGNSKLQPSSPNASSSIVDEMEPHHIHPSGKFINVETENVITAHPPPDPFVGAAKGQSNTFIDALRRTNYRPHEFPAKDPRMSIVGGHKASRVVTYDEDLNEGDEDVNEGNQDLEKTLVEPDAQEEHSETASQTSSTSQSFCSEDKLPSRNRSGSTHAKRDDEWREALQPHQRDTLDVLYDVSHHLVRHLVSKETAVQDLVNDYKRGGERLLSIFKNARKEELDSYQSRISESKRKLATLYKGAEEEMVRELEEVKRRPVREYEKSWQEHRRVQKARLEAALGALEQ